MNTLKPKPELAAARLDFHGRIDTFMQTTLTQINDDGVNKGYLEYIYIDGVYYLFYLQIYNQFRGQGLSSRLIQAFNSLLLSKSKKGILRNIINKDHPARDIYSNQGWTYNKDNSDWMTLEDHMDSLEIEKVIHKVETLEVNESFLLSC